jgi:hypothetical protein
MSPQLQFPWHPTPVGRFSRARAAGSAPRMAAAAVRIPQQAIALPIKGLAKGPQIFIHEGARQALERRFELAFGGPVQLGVTDNRRRMVTQTRTRGRLRVRLHMMFLGAEERVKSALVAYVVHADRDASQVVGDFIEQNLHRIRASRKAPGKLCSAGQVHDLEALLHGVNQRYFAGTVSDVLITWGRKTKPRGAGQRTSIKLGSYSATERLIRIHPVLDQRWVPRYFVQYIVYHELLHHLVPEARVAGRVLLHPPEFQRRERDFQQFSRALTWEQKHIDRLLRAG